MKYATKILQNFYLSRPPKIHSEQDVQEIFYVQDIIYIKNPLKHSSGKNKVTYYVAEIQERFSEQQSLIEVEMCDQFT